VLTLLAYVAWQLGPRTVFGRALIGLAFPGILVHERWTRPMRWRPSVGYSLAFCVPACSLFLFCEHLFLGTGHSAASYGARLAVILDALAEFLYQNAITTVLGLLTLVATYRSSVPRVERKVFTVATTTIALASLCTTVVCSFAFYGVISM
jgi:hypothetical protein